MTYLLALETSGKHGSVSIAAITGEQHLTIVAGEDLSKSVGSAQSLAPAIANILASSAITSREIQAIGLVTGPGSFTGLRVGIATAKVLAYAWKCSIVEVDSLDVIHWQWSRAGVEPIRSACVHAIMDAYRGQLFVKTSSPKSPGESTTAITRIVDLSVFLQEIRADEQHPNCHLLIGPGCERWRRFLDREIDSTSDKEWASKVPYIAEESTMPHANGVAALAVAKFGNGECTDPFSVLPKYFRASAAEEKKFFAPPPPSNL
jgi:tRNA threonylcarbamoyladenosine biosynthesis protein TsaB